MKEDEQGFLYPVVDIAKCISCGICEEVCPCLNQGEINEPLTVETAINPDYLIRKKSSSGGVFTMLANYVLDKDGVVFGARFNDRWEVLIDSTETSEGLAQFRGSKYLQAIVGDSFLRAESFLKKGRDVLFIGTPCQIAGLRLFLQKEYENLLTVAIACHSVPSPLVWREYLKGLRFRNVSAVNFRDKRVSWEQYGISIIHDNGCVFFQPFYKNPYMQLFLHGIITRPSCFKCPAKDGKSGADIMIGDCWGISEMLPSMPNDHQGISFVICLTEKGILAIKEAGVKGNPLQYNQLVANNGGLSARIKMSNKRDLFWNSFIENNNKSTFISHFARPYLPGLKYKLMRVFKHLMNK